MKTKKTTQTPATAASSTVLRPRKRAAKPKTTAPAVSINLTGQFLIAMPSHHSDPFERAVIYVCEHSERGALGIIVNRPTDIKVSEVLHKLSQEDQISFDPQSIPADSAVLMGGPVQTERGFVLHSPYREYAATIKINNQLGLTSSRDVLEDWAKGTGPEKMILALGYAGWNAGQLEDEIAHNVWLNVAANEHVLFETLLPEKYTQAMRLLGFNESMLTDVAGHA